MTKSMCICYICICSIIYVPASLLFRQIFMRATVVRTRLLTNMQIKNKNKLLVNM